MEVVNLVEAYRSKAEASEFHCEFLIEELRGDPLFCSRLRDVGFRRGLRILVTGRAPLKGPFYVRTQNSSWALRDVEAQVIWVRSESRLGAKMDESVDARMDKKTGNGESK